MVSGPYGDERDLLLQQRVQEERAHNRAYDSEIDGRFTDLDKRRIAA